MRKLDAFTSDARAHHTMDGFSTTTSGAAADATLVV